MVAPLLWSLTRVTFHTDCPHLRDPPQPESQQNRNRHLQDLSKTICVYPLPSASASLNNSFWVFGISEVIIIFWFVFCGLCFELSDIVPDVFGFLGDKSLDKSLAATLSHRPTENELKKFWKKTGGFYWMLPKKLYSDSQLHELSWLVETQEECEPQSRRNRRSSPSWWACVLCRCWMIYVTMLLRKLWIIALFCFGMFSLGGFLLVHSNQCVLLEQNQNLTTLSSFHQYIFAHNWKYASRNMQDKLHIFWTLLQCDMQFPRKHSPEA